MPSPLRSSTADNYCRPMSNPDQLLTRQQLAERWRVSPRTIIRMEQDGELSPVLIRGSIRYVIEDIRRIEEGKQR